MRNPEVVMSWQGEYGKFSAFLDRHQGATPAYLASWSLACVLGCYYNNEVQKKTRE